MSFDNALRIVLQLEGGYSNDPLDRGGATNYGIVQATYNDYNKVHRLPIRPVKQITPEEVKAIYERNYWLDGHCNFITESHPHVATIHFDCAVNCGLTQASKLLQRSVETLDDGIIGPVTLAAMKTLTDEVVAKNYLNHRLMFYTKLILHNPSQQKFKASWFHRLTKLSKELNLGWVAQ